ncbi:MAG: nuclear transport factor 2 family protein [Acidobacteria bacterium]|nr:nuclear transport factor 2 family protein [Acidobacteriota bacterium]
MQRLILIVVIVLAFGGVAAGQQPVADLVQAGVDAYNRQDVAYFEKMLAPDVVWLDDDGHAVAGKDRVLAFLRNQLGATPPRKLVVTNIRTGSTKAQAS